MQARIQVCVKMYNLPMSASASASIRTFHCTLRCRIWKWDRGIVECTVNKKLFILLLICKSRKNTIYILAITISRYQNKIFNNFLKMLTLMGKYFPYYNKTKIILWCMILISWARPARKCLDRYNGSVHFITLSTLFLTILAAASRLIWGSILSRISCYWPFVTSSNIFSGFPCVTFYQS